MSSPTKINSSPMGAREGQRVILREITKSIHNSPPSMNISDVISKVSPEHEVKVKFTREFGDVANYPPSINPEANNISSASNFQNLTSTLSTKSSSDINVADTITKINDTFNSNSDVSDLDDLISACAAIHLNDTTVITGEQSFADATFTSATDEINKISYLSGSRSNSPCPDINSTQIINNDVNASEVIYEQLNADFNSTQQISPQVIENNNHQDSYVKALTEQNTSPDYATANESLLQSVSLLDDVENNDKNVNNTFAIPLPPQDFIPLTESSSSAVTVETFETENLTDEYFDIPSKLPSSPPSILVNEESQVQVKSENSNCDSSQTPVDTNSITPIDNSSSENFLQSFPDTSTNCLAAIKEPTFIETQNLLDTNASGLTEPTAQSIDVKPEISNEDFVISVEQVEQEKNELSIEVSTNQQTDIINNQLDNSSAVNVNQIPTEVTSIDVPTDANLDATVDIHDISNNSLDAIEAENYKDIALEEELNTNIKTVAQINSEIIPQNHHEDYDNFLPPRQSTCLNDLLSSDSNSELPVVNNSAITEAEFFDAHNTLTSDHQIDFEKLKLAEKNIINDFNNSSLDLVNDQDHITNTLTDLWRDPTNFDFLLSKKANSATTDRLRSESLYVKFDPLVSNISMLPQGNGATAPPNEERNGEKEASMPNIGTPKRNSAIAAIDRLLFYSPMTPGNQKSEEPKKIEPTEKTTPEPIPIVDPIMAKELEIVRATVIELEEQLEKQKLENDQQEKEHKIDREAFQEAITQLQKQLNQEIKSKNQINVVVDEYEKSISRLVAERERDRKNLDVEKASLLEELQEVKNHLSASEAAFNDVHAKYERLKVVVTASKNNEAALKASIAENVEIIKTLEDRYDQIKTHAAVRLEKANLELEGIRKQHESETLKLRAMLRKEELKSSSLAEMIEQKTKENKELTKILDEVIARVDPGADK